MDLNWIIAVSGFAAAMSGTPGPNNTMVAASGANYGFRRTLPLMSGVTVGVGVIIMAVAAMGSSVVRDPYVHAVLKWVGIAYLLWLAWKIASARPTAPTADGTGERSGRPFTFRQGGLLQLVNPKLWVAVAGAIVTYDSAATMSNSITIGLIFALIFGLATFASTVVWTLIGAGIGRFARSTRAMRIFNYVMAGLLAVSLIPVIFE